MRSTRLQDFQVADWLPPGVGLDDVIGVPVVLGESVCGVLELRGRRIDPNHPHAGDEDLDVEGRLRYEARDLELLRIFAAYISSSIQNALDAIRARELARRDDLTGLYNDRFLYRRMTEEIARAERDGTTLSLLFLDLDEFKVVNDTWGHLAGSRTLREVGKLIGTALPPGGNRDGPAAIPTGCRRWRGS